MLACGCGRDGVMPDENGPRQRQSEQELSDLMAAMLRTGPELRDTAARTWGSPRASARHPGELYAENDG